MGCVEADIQKPGGLHGLHCEDGLICRVRGGVGRGDGHLSVDHLLPGVVVWHRATYRACKVNEPVLVWACRPLRVVAEVPFADRAGVVSQERFRQDQFAQIKGRCVRRDWKSDASSEAVPTREDLRTCRGAGWIRVCVAEQNPFSGQLIDVRCAGRVGGLAVATEHVIAKIVPENEDDVGHHLAPRRLA